MIPELRLVRLICLLLGVHTKPSCPAVSSTTLVSSKRSASAAGMEVSAETPGSKRQCVQNDLTKATTQTLPVQNCIYPTGRFSDLFCISRVLNLHIESGD